MKQRKRTFHVLTLLVLLLLSSSIQLKAQMTDTLHPTPIFDTSIMHTHMFCGTNAEYIKSCIIDSSGDYINDTIRNAHTYPLGYTPPGSFSAAAIDTCGKFAVYYEDVHGSFGIGFDDPIVGATRRATFCAVLTYLQSTFDFSAVATTDLIKLHVNVSYDNAVGFYAPVGTGFLGRATPTIIGAPSTITSGLLQRYVVLGIPAPTTGTYHADLHINFDRSYSFGGTSWVAYPITYQNDHTVPFASYTNCAVDLYSLLLHEMGHCLGWVSLVRFNPTALPAPGNATNLVPVAVMPADTYTDLDTAVRIGTVFPGAPSFVRLINTPATSPTLNTTTAAYCNNNYWYNTLAAPHNYPAFSGQYIYHDTFMVPSYIMHYDDQTRSYSDRTHISPGDRHDYVMGPYGTPGVQQRTYTKGEIQSFSAIQGYGYTGGDPYFIPNRLPFSIKMASYDLTTDYVLLTETITPDFTIANNGTPLVIDLLDPSILGPDLVDADGDTIRVDTTTLVNMRGCGNGNNHSQLAVSAGNTKITYTPLPNFYGRAQFGFNLFDGKEKGSFYIVTIEVTRGTAVGCTYGGNMVVNGNYENGTEQKQLGTEETIPNATVDWTRRESKFQGTSFSDGHPYGFLTNLYVPYGAGTMVHNSRFTCGAATILKHEVGSGTSSFPIALGLISPMSLSGSERYQIFTPSTSGYFNLTCGVEPCKRFILEFDAYNNFAGVTSTNINFSFKDDASPFLTPTWTYMGSHTFPLATGWQHITIPFWYCGSDTSYILNIKNNSARLALDNLILREDTTAPPPLFVTISDSVITPCDTTRLTAHPHDTACSVTYEWFGPGITGLTTKFVHVGPSVNTTYSVSVSDGCRTDTAEITVYVTPLPIEGPTEVCVGDSILLTDTATGGTWSSSDPLVATVNEATGYVTGVAGGTVTITYHYCGSFEVYVITVHPLPAAISGSLLLCEGVTRTLISAPPGGTWTSGTTSVATIDPVTGEVTSIMPGSTTITYTLPTGCKITAVLIVDAVPDVGPISPSDTTICVGESVTYSNATPGGIWSCSPSAIALIDASSGVLASTDAGTATVTYTSSSSGCFVTASIEISGGPDLPAITGPDTICGGGTDTMFNAFPGGIWTSSNTSVATVDPATGIVSGVGFGTAAISYSASDTCGTTSVSRIVIITGAPAPVPITGALGVCSGHTTTLHHVIPGGSWSGGPSSIATIDPVTGVVTGVAPGLATFSYSVTNMCGTTYITTNVLVDMDPYITTSSIVACQTGLAIFNFAYPVISGATECIKVCDSTVVRYYSHGVDSSDFDWSIVGGTIINQIDDSIDVLWTGVGLTGSITLHGLFSDCEGTATACIKIISKPRAQFTTTSGTYCLGQNVVFTNTSYTTDTASPIVAYIWNFGDGSGSGAIHAEHTYTAPGTYTVTLTAVNRCNCRSTYSKVITISDNEGPKIHCPSIVCQDDIATYSVDEPCGTYIWTIIGGTIVSGAGTASIDVKWDNPPADGYCYVSVEIPCALCAEMTTIKVPVILSHPDIAGPTVVCLGQDYEYSLPLWPATDYMWGVVGSPSSIAADCRKDHKIAIRFPSAGTYTIHGWYQNRLKLCGGNEFKTVVVRDTSSITGNRTPCRNASETYTIGAGTWSGDWTLKRVITGTIVASSLSSTSLSYTFTLPGLYLLSVSGDFCVEPISINVGSYQVPIDSVKGEDTVCLNRPYHYKAWTDRPSSVYSWEAVGGTVTPESGTSEVTIVWTDPGPKQVRVRHTSTLPPYCSGPVATINVISEVIDPDIVGDAVPCGNASRTYDCQYVRGEAYEWQIIPDSAGSVVSGGFSSKVSVLWNNVASITTAAIVVRAAKCDTIITDTLWANVQPSPLVAITPSIDTVCPGDTMTFTATWGDSAYVWNFGDGTPLLITTSNTVTHAFPQNATSTAIIYVVKVTPILGVDPAYGCQPVGVGLYNMPVKPGPLAYATSSAAILCSSATLYASMTSNVGGMTFQWYKNGTAIPGAIDTTVVITTTDTFYVIITADNGCWARSNLVKLRPCPVPGSGSTTCDTTHVVLASHSCYSIVATSPPIAGIYEYEWNFDVLHPPVSFTISPGGTAVTAMYDEPGIYHFSHLRRYIIASGDTCGGTASGHDTIPLIPHFRYQVTCATGGMDSVFLSDFSAYLPFYTITNVRWNDGTSDLGNGTNLGIAVAPSSSITITETVRFTGPGGTDSCSVTHTITTPDPPTVSFTFTATPTCEGIPVSFTPTASGGVVNYYWDFGDTTSSLLPVVQRTYAHDPLLGNPNTRYMTLTATDSIGCTANSIDTVEIWPNIINGDLGASNEIYCSDASPVTINWTTITAAAPIDSFKWSSGDTTIVGSTTVDESGAYWVTVKDIYGCQRTRPAVAKKITILPSPVAEMIGERVYCQGQTVKLSAYAGTGPWISYEWYKDGLGPVSTSYDLTESGASGIHLYKVIIGITDSATGFTCYASDSDSVYVYPTPVKPIISGPEPVDCNSYMLKLTATHPQSGDFNWSDGAEGPIDTIYRGGPYRVWFTNLYGCTNSQTVNVLPAPETYFQYFPKGCYELCESELPLKLNGPPCNASFDSWTWIDGMTDPSGIGSMSPYSITGSGKLQWSLDNGICATTSDTMDINVVSCEQCPDVHLSASLTCDTSDPAGFDLQVIFDNPAPGTTYYIGTNTGPVTPYTGVLGPIGTYTITPLTFTTFSWLPLPGSIVVKLELINAGGLKCFYNLTVSVPPCSWTSQRYVKDGGDSVKQSMHSLSSIQNSLIVAPNPTSGDVKVSYDYGADGTHGRMLGIYDIMGRKMDVTAPQVDKGTWNVSTKGWASGIYMVRMEGNGVLLQAQRLVVVNN